MKTVQCPYCSVNFETMPFRPMIFQCVRCGSDAEWYSGSVDGELRGLIAWSANDSTQAWLYNEYIDPLMQQLEQLESRIQMDFLLLINDAQDVAELIMAAIALLTDQLAVLEEMLAVEEDPTARAEILLQIETVVKKITADEQLMVQIEEIIVTIEATESELLVLIEQLKLAIEDSFYQIIDAITASNQADLSFDSTTDEYSTYEVWRDLTRHITQGFDDIYDQLLVFNLRTKNKILQIRFKIQR